MLRLVGIGLTKSQVSVMNGKVHGVENTYALDQVSPALININKDEINFPENGTGFKNSQYLQDVNIYTSGVVYEAYKEHLLVNWMALPKNGNHGTNKCDCQ